MTTVFLGPFKLFSSFTANQWETRLQRRSLSDSYRFRDVLAMSCHRKRRKGPSKDHVVVDGGERKEPDGKDLERHSSHGEGPADVQGLRCSPKGKRPLGGMGMSE